MMRQEIIIPVKIGGDCLKHKVYKNRGDLYFDMSDFEGSIEEYRQALVVEPDYPRAHFRLGQALQELGRSADARHEFDEVLRLVPPRSELAREVQMLLRAAQSSP